MKLLGTQHTTALINRMNSNRNGNGIVILTAHDAVFTPFDCGTQYRFGCVLRLKLSK